jgi:hypothetical protein
MPILDGLGFSSGYLQRGRGQILPQGPFRWLHR